MVHEIKYRWGRDEQGRAAYRLWSVKAKGDAAATEVMQHDLFGADP